MTKSTFRQVSSMADDAITVRVKRTTDGYIGILDFPTFHTSNGTIVRASMIPAFPVREALLKAIKIQPSTPFLVDCFQRLVPAFDGCDDLIRVGFPDEWLGFLIVLFDEAVDGSLQVDDRVKDAVLQTSACQFREEALDGVQP